MKAKPWEVIDNFGVGRLPSRSTFIPEINGIPSTVSLDGEWAFSFMEAPEESPKGFAMPDFDDSEWESIPVPSCWQMEGHEYPHYTNTPYAIPIGCAPFVPSANPTGIYRRSFFVPAEWAGRSIRIRFDGVDSAFELYVNGEFSGMGMGSRLPHEFDITDKIKQDDENVLAVRVVKWSAGTFLEDQDMWWLSGIFRSVSLVATPKAASVENLFFDTVLPDDFSQGTLKITADVAIAAKLKEQPLISFELKDMTGATVAKVAPAKAKKGKNTASVKVKSPRLWSAEDPYLYRLEATLKCLDAEEKVSFDVGWRKVEIKNSILMLNGQRLVFKGVDRHEFHTESGRTISKETMIEDILLMKRHNINAVRTSHYPDDPLWYELCDKFGIYLIDECDLETHGFGYTKVNITDDPKWEKACLDRMERMVSRDRNHPSVVMWSLGNEAYFGCNHRKMIELTRKMDPTRPIHYEGDYECEMVDVYSRMYPSVPECEDILSGKGPYRNDWMRNLETPVERYNSRPFVLCEYVHAMGNGPGCVKEYWDTIWKYERFAGAFVWEWIDHGIKAVDDDGKEFYAYGGDFGDKPHDGSFVCDGLIFPDRTPSPGLLELKQAMQPVTTELIDEKTLALRLTSRMAFTDISEYAASWSVLADGAQIASGQIRLPSVRPYASTDVKIPFKPMRGEKRELILVVSYMLKAATPWAEAGHELGFSQFIIKKAEPAMEKTPLIPPAKVDSCCDCDDLHPADEEEDNRYYAWAGRDFEIIFDRAAGTIVSWNHNGREVLESGPLFSFWRPTTSNDGKGIDPSGWRAQGAWRKHGLHDLRMRFDEAVVEEGEQGSSLSVPVYLAGSNLMCGIDCTMTFSVSLKGDLTVGIKGEPVGTWETTWPRVGIQLRLPLDLGTTSWYGRGPGESYSDTCAAGKFGIWTSPTEDLKTRYVVPQENGSHFETRWVEFAANKGRSLRITSSKPFCFGVNRYETMDIEEALHDAELVEEDYFVLSLDMAQDGIGTGSCGPRALPKYDLKAEPFKFEWTFSAK